jgi:hypothetical protein
MELADILACIVFLITLISVYAKRPSVMWDLLDGNAVVRVCFLLIYGFSLVVVYEIRIARPARELVVDVAVREALNPNRSSSKDSDNVCPDGDER